VYSSNTGGLAKPGREFRIVVELRRPLLMLAKPERILYCRKKKDPMCYTKKDIHG
jgi:hypothetical protein